MNEPQNTRVVQTWTGLAIGALVVITVFHYATHADVGNVDSHTLFRRMYYLPIAVLAVLKGMRGGGLAAVGVTLVYSPHAFMTRSVDILGVHIHADPSPQLEKISEIILYLALGLLVGYVVDKAKEARAELDSARVELERSARLSALGRLVAGVAHEVRNPLASLHTTAEMFLDDYEQTHEKRRMVELNFEEVKRLEAVVTRFLEFANPGPPRRESTNLQALLERARALVQSTAKAKGVSVRVDPDTLSEEVVFDPDQILQVMLNLALNAVDASESGGVVVLGAHWQNGDVVLEVADQGVGVPPELREQIFEPFFTTRAEGTGLGLSVANQIAKSHGGSLSFEPNQPRGARFRLRLPRDGARSRETRRAKEEAGQ